jgi:hypothetical protein
MINLKFQFKPFIKMAVEHEYYSPGEDNEMYFLPTSRTVNLLNKMSMMLRHKEGVLNVLFDTSKTELLYHRLLQTEDKDLKLSFLLFSKNPYFINFTDVPVDIQGKVLYCSNKSIVEKNNGYLHESLALGKEEIISTTPEYLKDNEPEKNAFTFSLDDLNENVQKSILPGHQIEASSLNDGLYRIFANDKELSSFVNIGMRTKNSPIGYVDIFLGGIIKKRLLNEIENNQVPSFDYKIKFLSRSIHWKYNVVPLHTKRVKKLTVTTPKQSSKIEFKSLGEFEYNDNRMFSFISEKSIKYQKQYDYEIQLKKHEGEGNGKILVKKLAFAPFDSIKPYDDTNYMSEIYVYI